MRATIKDVAREAGVSVSTVSYALSRKGKVTKESHRRVLAAAEKLGYVPDATARSLVNSRMNTIGVIMPGMIGEERQNPYYVEIISIFSEELARRELWMSLYMTDADHENRDVLSDLLIDAKMDGIVWISVHPNEQESAILERRALPCVLVNSIDRRADSKLPQILVDSEAGMNQAVRHLSDMGHEKIMFVSGIDRESAPRADDRADYYDTSMEAAGLTYRKILYADFDENIAYVKMKDYIASGEEMPTAVICASDSMAFGIMRALKESGLSVPDDVSVIGYDDIFAGRHSQPTLSTIKQRIPEAAVAAVDFIFECRDTKEISPDFVRKLDTKLIVRESSGPVKK